MSNSRAEVRACLIKGDKCLSLDNCSPTFPPHKHKHRPSWRRIYMRRPCPSTFLQMQYADFGPYVSVIQISTDICANDRPSILLVNSPSRLQTPPRSSLLKCGTNSSGTRVEGAAHWTCRRSSHPTRPLLRLEGPRDRMISTHYRCLV